jgi:hypothetical protein
MNSDKHEFQLKPEELLAAYEAGLLNDQDRARFEAATLENPDLLEELYEMAPFNEALHADPARVRESAEAELREFTPSPQQTLLRALRALLRPRMLVPVAVAMVAFFVVLNLDEGIDDVRRLAMIEPLAYVQVDVRSVESDREVIYREAMVDYQGGAYLDAVFGLTRAITHEETAEPWPHLDQAQLYLGVSHLMLEKADQAITPLNVAAASPLLPVADNARWYLAQANLMQGNASGARELLLDLADTSPVHGEAAGRLIAQIDQLIND